MGKQSKRCDLVIKSVAFNVLNPLEKRLLEHLNAQTNASRYMKRLIDRDVSGTAESIPHIVDDVQLVAKGNEEDLIEEWMDE